MALHLTLLGSLRLSPDEGREAVVLPTRKARALLAYLACTPGRAHPRDKLAALLWGDRPDSQARASLRQEVYGLRRALAGVEPTALRLVDDSVALEPASVEVDVLLFERLVTEGTPAALEAAVALYQGELLEGIAIEASAFEEWLLGERERLRERAIEAMARLLAHQRSAGALEASVQTGLRLLALEPAQESVHRAVIRLHLRLGRRGAARRQYQICVDTLQRELGAEPEAETKQLYQEILRAARPAGGVEAGVIGELLLPPTGAAPLEEPSPAENPSVASALARMPFIGRQKEIERLEQKLEAARSGTGGLTFLVGEGGIGKTRLLEEFTARARAAGARVLSGRCFEGEFDPPFGPFAAAISSYARSCDGEALQEDLGSFGAVVAKIVPELRDRFPNLPQPAALTPEEERFRLLDAVAQVLWAFARRAPLVLVLDDLHWADGGTLALLRYLGRFLQRHRVLLLGAYRDVELDRQQALGDTLVALRREVELERIALSGLPRETVAELLEMIAPHDEVPANFAEVIAAETAGNPFFLREMLLHLLEEGKLEPAAGRFTSRFSIEEMGIPESLREVIRRRLARLSKAANRLLSTASGFGGIFRFDVAARAADLDEPAALDALDEGLGAQLLRATGDPEVYDFTHALIRHTLYGELAPARQVRLHRRLAEEMERVHSDPGKHAGEIATQWHRSAAIAGAERGVLHCVAAADAAEKAAAHEEAASFLGMALDLLPEADARRARLLARRGLALARSLVPEEAVRVASEAGELLATSEGSDAAADYLADAATEVYGSSYDPRASALAAQGLRHAGGRRDLTWARLAAYDLDRRPASDPGSPEIHLDVPERFEASRILLANLPSLIERGSWVPIPATIFESREDAIERAGVVAMVMAYWAGEYVRSSALASDRAADYVKRGRLGAAATLLVVVTRCQSALGNLAASREALARAAELAERIGTPSFLAAGIQAAHFEHMGIQGEGYRLFLPMIDRLLAADARWFRSRWAFAAAVYAHERRVEDALRMIDRVLPTIERPTGWTPNYPALLFWVIEALWILERSDHADRLGRNLREKTLAPDFRHPHTDARLALARLCALTGRVDEARKWFDKARRVLDEQGARPLRAVVDFDEAWMEARRGRAGDREHALALLDAARGPFEEIGMSGWSRRADELRQQLER